MNPFIALACAVEPLALIVALPPQLTTSLAYAMLVCGTSHPDSTMLPAASKLAAATNRLRFILIASPRNSIRVENCSYSNPHATKQQTNWSMPGPPHGWDTSNDAQMWIATPMLNCELPMDGQRVTVFQSLAGQSYFGAQSAPAFATRPPSCPACRDSPVLTNAHRSSADSAAAVAVAVAAEGEAV